MRQSIVGGLGGHWIGKLRLPPSSIGKFHVGGFPGVIVPGKPGIEIGTVLHKIEEGQF